MRAEFRRLGIPFEERSAMTDEYLRAMRELWISDVPSFAGKHVSFDDVSFYPRPVQPGGIPLLIGGSGPRPFTRVAELGSGWLPMAATAAELVTGLAAIRRLMLARGRGEDVDALIVGAGVSLGDDPQVREMRGHVEGVRLEPTSRRSPADVVSDVRELVGAGANLISLSAPWQTPKDLRRNLHLLASEVIPAFR